jgi:hypothetical protein
MLETEVANINVARSLGRARVIDYLDSAIIIFIDGGRTRLWKTEVVKDVAKVFDNFCSGSSCDKFSFSRALGTDWLCLGAPSNSTASKTEYISGGGTSFTEFIGMSSVNVADELGGRTCTRDGREFGIARERMEGARRQCSVKRRTPIINTPFFCLAKIECYPFQGLVVDLGWSNGELGQSCNGITDVGTTYDIGIE